MTPSPSSSSSATTAARSCSMPPSNQNITPIHDLCPSCQGLGYVDSKPCLMCPGPSLARFVTFSDGAGSKSHSPPREARPNSGRTPSKISIATPDRLKAKWSLSNILASLSTEKQVGELGGDESDVEEWAEGGSDRRGRKSVRRRINTGSLGKRKNKLLAESAFREIMQELKA
ncbi:hypothetical protein HDV00_000436 [Rhizophlyctis rosea]|nr:hypothetical protein HDV00_000436 [Rhizophlyctis rosea]